MGTNEQIPVLILQSVAHTNHSLAIFAVEELLKTWGLQWKKISVNLGEAEVRMLFRHDFQDPVLLANIVMYANRPFMVLIVSGSNAISKVQANYGDSPNPATCHPYSLKGLMANFFGIRKVNLCQFESVAPVYFYESHIFVPGFNRTEEAMKVLSSFMEPVELIK